MANFYGIYRGVVTSTADPKDLGRIKVKVPQVLGADQSLWSWPLYPANMDLESPIVGQGVWIAFQNGDAGFPLWWGSFGTPKTNDYYLFFKRLLADTYPDTIQIIQNANGKSQLDVVETLVSLATTVETLETSVADLESRVTALETAQAEGFTISRDNSMRIQERK